MYRTGHYGVSLLVYAPVGAALLRADAPLLAVLGGTVMVALASFPDVDLRIPFVPHRGPTHTLWFALVVGAGTGAVGYYSAGLFELAPMTLARFGFAVGTFAIVAHLLGDVLTPMGIEPLRPLSSRNYSLRLTRADNTVANWLLLALGVFATVVVLGLAGRVA
ncbi:metal-dependent hydrolase [Haloarchaeobius sp. TZWWS8]|uniref:metal-dependent hydrolase n=1 Tax=Haloarchaeobius sp. TZWWS8 TaxID=3446121 RepID=UPI003EB92369